MHAGDLQYLVARRPGSWREVGDALRGCIALDAASCGPAVPRRAMGWQAPPEDALALGEAALAAGGGGGARGLARLLEAAQDRLLLARYPAGLRARLAEPPGGGAAAPAAGPPADGAPAGASGPLAGGDPGPRPEAASLEPGGSHADAGAAGPAGLGGLVQPAAAERSPGCDAAGRGAALRGAAPLPGPADAGAEPGTPGASPGAPRACEGADAPYDPALLHLARTAGGELPHAALQAARRAAAAANWRAAAIVLGRLPSLASLVAALAWDDLGRLTTSAARGSGVAAAGDGGGIERADGSGQAGGQSAARAAGDIAPEEENGAAEAAKGGPGGPGGPGADSVATFRRRRALLAALDGLGFGAGDAAAAPAGPAAATLRRLRAQLRWRVDLAERVCLSPNPPPQPGALDGGDASPGGVPPTGPPGGHAAGPHAVAAAVHAPDGGDSDGGPGSLPGASPRAHAVASAAAAAATATDSASAAAAGGAAREEATAAEAVLEALAQGRSALGVLRGAARRLDGRGVLAALHCQPEAVRTKRPLARSAEARAEAGLLLARGVSAAPSTCKGFTVCARWTSGVCVSCGREMLTGLCAKRIVILRPGPPHA